MESTPTEPAEIPTNEAEEAPQLRQVDEMKFESSMPLEEAIAYFEAIVGGLKKGTLHLQQGDDALSLHPPVMLSVEVKASRKKDKERIGFEIKWQKGSSQTLNITSAD